MAITISLTIYCINDSLKKSYEMHECDHQLVEITRSLHKKIDRNFKEIQHAIFTSEDQKKLELIKENLELQWQNEKLVRELLNMFNLLRGKEMPLSNPAGKTKI